MVEAGSSVLAKPSDRRPVIALPASQDTSRPVSRDAAPRETLKRKVSETGKGKGGEKRQKYNWDFGYNSNNPIISDPASSADLFRHFRFEGCRLPDFQDLPAENYENYKMLSKSVGHTLGWYNVALDSFCRQLGAAKKQSGLKAAEDRIASLTAELEVLRVQREDDVAVVKRAEKNQRLWESAEARVMHAENERVDMYQKYRAFRDDNVALTKDKLALEVDKAGLVARLDEAEARINALTSAREIESARAKDEAKKAVAEMVRAGIEQVRLHFAARDVARESSAYFREVSANLELLTDITKGEVADFKAELEVLTTDTEAAKKASIEAEAKIPPLDLDGFVRLFSGSPPPPTASSPVATPLLTPIRTSPIPPSDATVDGSVLPPADVLAPIDEFGSNLGPKMDEMIEGIRAATEEDHAHA